jgi:ABC-type transport system substrate-binding protein
MIGAAMKYRATSRAFIAAAFLAAICIAPGANAFTIENQGGASGGQGYLELDKPAAAPDRHAPVSRFGTENGQTTIKQGNSTFQFGQQRSFGERYNTNNIFDPYAREGR